MYERNYLDAVFLSSIKLPSEISFFEITPGLLIKRSEETPEFLAYEELCRNTGYHDGDPFHFESHIYIDESSNVFEPWDFIYNYRNPYSLISKILSVLSIIKSLHLDLTSAIQSYDNFKSVYWFMDIFHPGPYFEMYSNIFAEITTTELVWVKKCWKNLNSSNYQKINFTIAYFNNALLTYNLEQACINLAVVIESLFSPDSNNELSHQISFFMSKYLGDTPERQIKIYDLLKRFYSLRSKIIHGTPPKDDDLMNIIPEVFDYTCDVLKSILMEKENIEKFF